MKVQTHLPNEIHSITYVKNSHWIELEDNDGVRHKMYDNGLMRYDCDSCKFYFLTESNAGALSCPQCHNKMSRGWQRMQVCFVPEKESEFHMPQKDEE